MRAQWRNGVWSIRVCKGCNPIEEEESVASPPLVSYYLGLGICRNRKNSNKFIPTCRGVKKNPRTQPPDFHMFVGNFHPYHARPAEPTQNLMSEPSHETQERKIHDPSWIADVLNELIKDQGETHRFEVWQSLGTKPQTTTEEDDLSLLFDHTM